MRKILIPVVVVLVFAAVGRADGVWRIECVNGQCRWVQVAAVDLPKAATTPPSKSSVTATTSITAKTTVSATAGSRFKLPILRAAVVRTTAHVQTASMFVRAKVRHPFNGRFRCP